MPGDTVSEPNTIIAYIDLKSPYSYLALAPARQLAWDCGLSLDWRPLNLDLEAVVGPVAQRTPQQTAKLKYLYMDARRLAEPQGLTIRAPRQVYDSAVANIGMLYAQTNGAFFDYTRIAFARFFDRALDPGDAEAVTAILAEAGVDTSGFAGYLAGAGRAHLTALAQEALALGVFGVPTFIHAGELFWGADRLPLLRARLENA